MVKLLIDSIQLAIETYGWPVPARTQAHPSCAYCPVLVSVDASPELFFQVHDKLDKISSATGTPLSQGTPRSSFDARRTSPNSNASFRTSHPGAKAEDLYQILCNDTVLSLDMTLAAVRQFVWRQSTELTMYYRRKEVTPPEDSVLVARAM